MTDKATLRQLIKELPASKLLDAERFLTYMQQEDVLGTLERPGGDSTLYDSDFYAWTQAQAEALQVRNWPALDLDHLREEIADLGSNLEHELESRLVNLLLYLLKWRYQPERRGKSWRNSAVVARQRIARRLRSNPSLRRLLPAYLVDAYADAKKLAVLQTDLPPATFPEACPWPLEQVLDEDFLPEETI